ncbi:MULTISPECIES: M20/M25/M40 family metallo-hydrolase [unclassified Variovorax]|uniref:M20/M25/M40 family metallo-hydrolase n=1 Tax=unclassified Variovorax TaxID=663243 RepID=UPI00076D7361|nr:MULTISPECIES: M20/M25/M40 family metallo-hydrolase [unclassified Variovorax]KWT97117.1 Glutamate carboxypeptidase [Variovorax sp. WDL1]PNG55648.1 Carboxypeptidase G2 [Variovorax sp. B4]PNG57072.1 Carboxypeptidase G2 [Variovorax sp. B2]VTV10629.1 Carboxypeptidase G2 precursor [Variovorax sp. WDL1]
MKLPHSLRTLALGVVCAAWLGIASAAPDERIAALAAKEKPALLETLKQLVSIESGSRDLEGLDKIANLIAERLEAMGGQVELVDPTAEAYRMEDTPEKIGKAVRATFKGTGSKKIMLIAHMDTVYQIGMLNKQPFRIEGDKAYGLGIADDKQGVAVILHAVALLKALDFKEYGTLTVLINGDEEISSPGSRALISRLGAEHDVVMSYEGASVKEDKLSLATAGIASVSLNVTGKASHAGSAPELGVNALYELSHQILQMRDLSDPATGLKMNWTISKSGTNRNVIPASASAAADVRVLKVSDYDRIEKQVQERVKKQLVPEAKVEMKFERRRPPLEATDASRALATHAQAVYKELGRSLGADDKVAGGGTDAAFAALQTKAPVVERFGLQGFGAHSADAEYVLVDSIEPRLYLAARMVMDISRGKVAAR